MTAQLTATSVLAFALALPITLPGLSPEESRSAAQKLGRISDGEMAPGEQITLTEGEINSFLRHDYAPLMPDGVSNLQINLETDVGIVSGRADFSQVEAQDFSTRLLLMMLRGERNFVARVRYVSARGVARADIESLLVDGRELKGPILDWIVKNYVQTDMEGFALGQPTPLSDSLEQIRLEPGQAVVVASEVKAGL